MAASVLVALVAGAAPAAATPPDTAPPATAPPATAPPDAAPPATAPPGERTVRLRDGTLFRGQVVREVPDDHIVIRLPTGEVRRVEWADIVELTGPPAPAPPPPPPAPIGPRVTIESNEPNVALYAEVPETTTWVNRWGHLRSGVAYGLERVCQAPCGRELAPGEYSIGGDGIRSSATFHVPPGSAVRLDVTARRWSGPAGGGAALTVLGSVAMVAGAVLLVVGAKKDVAPLGNPWFTNDDGRPFTIAGGAVLGSGGALLISGIVVLAHFRTRVAIDGTQVALKLPGTRLALGSEGLRF